MAEPECGNCKFWKDIDKHNAGNHGQCRRFPPVVVSLPPSQIDGHGDGDTFNPWDATVFPETWNDDWCGEYQPK
jgi:hypothetical protein